MAMQNDTPTSKRPAESPGLIDLRVDAPGVDGLAACRSALESNADTIASSVSDRLLLHNAFDGVNGSTEGWQQFRGALPRHVKALFAEDVADGEKSTPALVSAWRRLGLGPGHHLVMLTVLATVVERFLANSCRSGGFDAHGGRLVAMTERLLLDTERLHALMPGAETAAVVEVPAESEEVATPQMPAAAVAVESRLNDDLTGVQTRVAFLESLEKARSGAERYRDILTLVHVDVNLFAEFNSEHGEEEGDSVLSLLGSSLLETLRKEDTAGRLQEDDFAILMPKTTDEQALELFRRLIRGFKEKAHKGVTFSIGIVQCGRDNYPTSEELLATAESRMRAAQSHVEMMPGFYIRRDDPV
ncbi:MAG: GGDEF domain-containing protein [Magnetococcales bacterium]|nr:GGDEF domain-containing protein [Magnetococcales bacterium]